DKVLELTGRDPRARHVDPVAMELRAANNAAMLCPTDGGVLRELHEEKAAEAVTKPGRKAPAAEEPLPEHVAEAMYAAGLKAQQEHERRNLPPEEYARLKARRERDRTLAEASREGLKQFVAIQVERLQAWADAHLTTANLDQ